MRALKQLPRGWGGGCAMRSESCVRPGRAAGTSTYATCVSPAARPRVGCSADGIHEVRPPPEFRGDLHSYVAQQQNIFKKARDARDARDALL